MCVSVCLCAHLHTCVCEAWVVLRQRQTCKGRFRKMVRVQSRLQRARMNIILASVCGRSTYFLLERPPIHTEHFLFLHCMILNFSHLMQMSQGYKSRRHLMLLIPILWVVKKRNLRSRNRQHFSQGRRRT